MALEITKDTQYGVSATYWRITSTSIDWANRQVTITVGGYASSTIRQAGAVPISQVSIGAGDDTTAGGFPLSIGEAQDALAALYAAVKLEEFFIGAIDV